MRTVSSQGGYPSLPCIHHHRSSSILGSTSGNSPFNSSAFCSHRSAPCCDTKRTRAFSKGSLLSGKPPVERWNHWHKGLVFYVFFISDLYLFHLWIFKTNLWSSWHLKTGRRKVETNWQYESTCKSKLFITSPLLSGAKQCSTQRWKK